MIVRRHRSPLLVSLLDGSVAAVDEASGHKLWTYDTGAPLVSNKVSLTQGSWLNQLVLWSMRRLALSCGHTTPAPRTWSAAHTYVFLQWNICGGQ